MIVARILDPRSKLATARGLSSHTASDSLADMLDLADADENELYQAMDWLLQRQTAIETRLAGKHLQEGAQVLYDLSSTWFEAATAPWLATATRGTASEGSLQLVFGLLCDRQGWPLAIEAFQGDTADPSTVAAQVNKMRKRFGLSRVVLVGDRGLLTEARIREDLKPAGLDWISALRGPALRALVEQGALQPSLFDQRDLAEITCPTSIPGTPDRVPQPAAGRGALPQAGGAAGSHRDRTRHNPQGHPTRAPPPQRRDQDPPARPQSRRQVQDEEALPPRHHR